MNILFYFFITVICILVPILLFTLVENIKVKHRLTNYKIKHEKRLAFLKVNSQQPPGTKSVIEENTNTKDVWFILKPSKRISLAPGVVQIPKHYNGTGQTNDAKINL